jgi:hypothetical protein
VRGKPKRHHNKQGTVKMCKPGHSRRQSSSHVYTVSLFDISQDSDESDDEAAELKAMTRAAKGLPPLPESKEVDVKKAYLSRPYGVGTLAIVDSEGDQHCVHIVTLDGSKPNKVIGNGFGSGDGQLNFPQDVAFTPDGRRIAVADYSNHRISLFSIRGGPSGKWIGSFGLGSDDPSIEPSIAYPGGVTIDANGYILVVDCTRLSVFDAHGQFVKQLVFPMQGGSGICLHPHTQQAIVCQAPASGSHRVIRYDLIHPNLGK